MSYQKDADLSELLDDPIVTLLMKRDGVSREYVCRLMREMQRKLYGEPERLAA